jgi:Fe-S-cluster containining protein
MGWKVKRRPSVSGPLARMQAVIAQFQQHERDRRRDLARVGPQSAAIVGGPLVAGTVARVAMMVAGAFQNLPRAERVWQLGVALAGWGQSQVDALLGTLPPSSRPACRAGCAACCVIPVSASPLEALTIAETLRRTLSRDALAALLSRLRTRVHERRGWDREQRWAQRRPCVFLTPDRLCSIYQVRPMLCRGYTSRRREDCETEGMERVEHLIPLTMFVNGVHLGLRETFTAAGWDHRSIELESGVLCALETPDAEQRWQEGEPVFHGCDRLADDDPVASQELWNQFTRTVDVTRA